MPPLLTAHPRALEGQRAMIFEVVREFAVWFGTPERRATYEGIGVPAALAKALRKATPADRVAPFLAWARKQKVHTLLVNGGLTPLVAEMINALTPTGVGLDCVEPKGLFGRLSKAAAATIETLAVRNADEPSLDGLERLSALEQLTVDGYATTAPALGGLKRAPASLTSLELVASRPLDLGGLTLPPGLRSLAVQCQDVVSLPKKAPPLRELTLFTTRSFEGLALVAGLTSLEKLDLHCSEKAKVDLSALTSIRELRLVGVVPAGLEALRALESVNLHLSTSEGPGIAFEPADLRGASGLRDLSLYGAKAAIKLAPLGALTKLQVLCLGEDFKPTLAQLEPFAGKGIELRDCRLGDTVDGAIAALKKKR